MVILSEIEQGEQVIITGFKEHPVALKLMEMGLLPGEIIKVISFAPLGDPMSIYVSGYLLSLRLDEASQVMVRPVLINHSQGKPLHSE